jgi:O-antigen/teichoic acid export membrane protein
MAGLGDIRDVMRGAIASFFGFGGRLIARTILMVIAGRAYGIEALGILGQVAAIAEIAGALGVMGLKRGLLDMLSFKTENGGRAETRIAEALGVAVFFSFLISTGLLFIWPYILPDHTKVIPFLFFAIPAITFTEVALAAIKHKRIIKWDVWTRGIIEPWGFLLLVVVFLWAGTIHDGLVVAYVGSNLAAALLAGLGLIHAYGLRSLVQSKPQLSNWFFIIRQSAPVGITDLGVMMLRRIDLIVLSIFVGPQGAGLYYMVQQLATVPQKVNALFEPMMSPVMARLHNRKDTGKIRSNLIGICRWVLILQLAISIPMVVFGDYLLSIFGVGFAAGATVLAVILLAELIDGSFATVETPLVFAKPKIPPTLIFITLIIEITVIAALSSIWGVEGAAAGFLIAITCLTAGRLYMLKKHLNINVINAGYILPIVFAVGVLAALAAIRHLIGPQQGLIIIAFYIAGSVGFIYLVKSFALTNTDRILFLALTQLRRRLAAP